MNMHILTKTKIMKKLLLILLVIPLIGFGQTKTYKEITVLPIRNINSIAATITAIYQQDEGALLSIKGSRFNANSYIVDGIRVRGVIGIPTSAIEKITVINGTINFNISTNSDNDF